MAETKRDPGRFLRGGGEMGELTRAFAWSQTNLGNPETWPTSLLTAVSIVLNSRFPMFIWWGPDLIQFYNDAYRPSLGNNGKHPMALGQKGADCWPEIWPVIKPLIDQVLSGGGATWSEDQLIPIYRNGRIEDVYWTFSYTPIIDSDGDPGGVLVVCHETTQKVRSYLSLDKLRRDMERAEAEAVWQRDRLKNFFMQAPAGICILDGPNMVFELVNPSYQRLFPDRQLLGLPLLEALPELRDSLIWDTLQDVYSSGKGFEAEGLLVPLARYHDAPPEDRWFNFIYQTRHDSSGKIDGILVFAFEVTDMVTAKNQLTEQQDKLRLAMNAAELGTFDIDLRTGIMDWDVRCRTLFGISHSLPVSYETDFIAGLHPDDRATVEDVIASAMDKKKSNGDYNIEYRTIAADDGRIRWIRAKGRVYFDANDKPTRFVGSVLDVTEQKADEIRKSDFIGMVSHELKTPLTSLKAYAQVLQSRAEKEGDEFSAGLLRKMNNQVKKMTSMINGFLNVSRLESGKIHLNKQTFDLGTLLAEQVEEAMLMADTHILTAGGGGGEVEADRDKIGAVISNLLSNAMKYSPRGTRVYTSCEKKDNMVQICVHDEGFGINAADLPNIFKRYYRVRNDSHTTVSGFGIGLYLCSEIVNGHQGKIWVESEPGAGSRFYFSLPECRVS